MGAGSLAVLMLVRRFIPRLPRPIVAVVLASVAVKLFDLPVETIGTRFGGVPRTLPIPSLPHFSLAQARALIPEAASIGILTAIESLLSAVVGDGMTGGRHKSDCELVGQGIANIGSVLFGGIPATGAIARTVTNFKSGGRTPVAGMIHAVALLVILLVFAPYAGAVPLAALAAVLVIVAWNMAQIDHFRYLLRAPRGDMAVLLTTFGLTVLADLTVAVGVGMVLASFLFMKRMSEVSNISAITQEAAGGADELPENAGAGQPVDRKRVPRGVEVYEINGPYFFGVADRLKDTLNAVSRRPRVFILQMRSVPAIDGSGLHALEEFYDKCRRQGIVLLLAGVHARPLFALTKSGLIERVGVGNMFPNLETTLEHSRELVHRKPHGES